MATLALGLAGSAIGGALLPGGISVLGATVTGAAIGGAVGSLAGAFIDQSLAAPLVGSAGGTSHSTIRNKGPRISDVRVSTSAEGTPLPRVYGRSRQAGLLIWATRFQEVVKTTSQTTGGTTTTQTTQGGGKGGGLGGGGAQTTTQTSSITTKTTTYSYFANVAYAVCEGEITRVGRIWADGKEINQSKYNFRVYRGTEAQTADSLIAAKEGAAAPAYRGTAYVVFERMPLADFGNRLPQMNFEVFRATDNFEKQVRAIDMTPAAGEFVYDPDKVIRIENGVTIAENLHSTQGGTDWKVSVDQLEDQLPNVQNVALVVTWFGDDLRIGACTLRPGVEVSDKITQPYDWSVAGLARDEAYVVSGVDGRPAYGGTPADRCVVKAIKDLKARGYGVTFYPFISMDIPEDNSLTDPYSGATGQPPHPWRGRITCTPAPGEPGTADKTSACAAQVANFVGACEVSDFAISGESVVYSGDEEWSYRRLILHYAHLCKAAGGVDAFLIGSEMRGSTFLRSSASNFPFVNALVDLAGDVRSVVGGGTKITYAADWSEFPGRQPGDGTGDVYFHLDPLWASDDIDAIGIDIYWPLSDWRDGDAHLDRQAGWASIYDLDCLRSNLRGGEGFEWYYPSSGFTGNEVSAERAAQERTLITDGAYGKPWVYKPKALKEWWQNQHYNRPGGVEAGSPTAWVPQSKPIWFTELGCPAVDKGANQPNVFVDPKSVESYFPYFSRQVRDDLMQRRYIQAFLTGLDPADEDYVSGSNPVSGVYGGRMIDLDRIYIYNWDARPYPTFPYATSVWGDTDRWERGHWLTGRIGGGQLSAIVRQMLEDYGFTRFTTSQLYGFVDGYVIDSVMSARDALDPLGLAFFFDAYESGGLIQFAHRGQIGSLATVTPEDLVETTPDDQLYMLMRGQETELPLSAKITYLDGNADYEQAAVEARRLNVRSDRVAATQMPMVLPPARAQAIAESWLRDTWAARERASFALPPSRLALEPTDMVTLQVDGRDYRLRITETQDAEAKAVTALSIEPAVYEALNVEDRVKELDTITIYGPTDALFLDLPLLRGDESPALGYVTAKADPWPPAVAVYRSPSSEGYLLNTIVSARPTAGATLWDFYSGPINRYDMSSRLRVRLDYGELESATEEQLLNGANSAAIRNADGDWEVIQFQIAELVDTLTYDLSVFLRGQSGTDGAMRDFVAAGAPFVMLDSAVTPVSMTPDDIGLAYNWKFGPTSEGLDDSSYGSAVHAFKGLTLRPLRPVRLKGSRDPDTGDWTLTWIRQDRIGADSWASYEIPLSEENERYRLEILDEEGGAVLRTVELTEPLFFYTAAMQEADLSETVWNVPVRVAQVSQVWGPGVPAEFETYDYQH